MGRRALTREESAARLRALTRRAYTASSGHLDLDDDAGREFDRIVRGEPADDAAGRTPFAARRWAVSLRAAVVVLAVLAALTGVVVLRSLSAGSAPITVPETAAGEHRGHGAGEETARADPEQGAGGPGPTPVVATSPTTVAVHVAGAVTEPGVVELPDGARVAQAIEAAGGAGVDAELAAVNLARPVQDGEQVYVPRVGEAPPGAAAGPVTSGQPAAAGQAVPEPEVDLNTAGSAALETLPGVGPAIAQRIVDWRAAHGPFHSVEELLEVSGIGPATLERLRERVRV